MVIVSNNDGATPRSGSPSCAFAFISGITTGSEFPGVFNITRPSRSTISSVDNDKPSSYLEQRITHTYVLCQYIWLVHLEDRHQLAASCLQSLRLRLGSLHRFPSESSPPGSVWQLAEAFSTRSSPTCLDMCETGMYLYLKYLTLTFFLVRWLTFWCTRTSTLCGVTLTKKIIGISTPVS